MWVGGGIRRVFVTTEEKGTQAGEIDVSRRILVEIGRAGPRSRFDLPWRLKRHAELRRPQHELLAVGRQAQLPGLQAQHV